MMHITSFNIRPIILHAYCEEEREMEEQTPGQGWKKQNWSKQRGGINPENKAQTPGGKVNTKQIQAELQSKE